MAIFIVSKAYSKKIVGSVWVWEMLGVFSFKASATIFKIIHRFAGKPDHSVPAEKRQGQIVKLINS
ncbi:hypothetical protein BWK69_01255 [Candidatus Parcubacteria bacterium A4]|nr:MAG: hypothetical protein BWK69_01255 [Candidatus Parcubacteria bacterium A4]